MEQTSSCSKDPPVILSGTLSKKVKRNNISNKSLEGRIKIKTLNIVPVLAVHMF